MTEKDLVAITTQSFAEAGGVSLFPHLEMDQTIIATTNEDRMPNGVLFQKVNDDLVKKARELGYTHLFGVQYEFGEHQPCKTYKYGGQDLRAIATGYKPKEI